MKILEKVKITKLVPSIECGIVSVNVFFKRANTQQEDYSRFTLSNKKKCSVFAMMMTALIGDPSDSMRFDFPAIDAQLIFNSDDDNVMFFAPLAKEEIKEEQLVPEKKKKKKVDE